MKGRNSRHVNRKKSLSRHKKRPVHKAATQSRYNLRKREKEVDKSTAQLKANNVMKTIDSVVTKAVNQKTRRSDKKKLSKDLSGNEGVQINISSYEERDLLFGHHEIQLTHQGETNLQLYAKQCPKNPGHKNFIPVQKFSLSHLPKGYRDVDLYEVIRGIADFTVKVEVRITSKHRPRLWPRTKVQYPLYDKRGKPALRCGTGRVIEVEKFVNGLYPRGARHEVGHTSCWCEQCESSRSPKKTFWEIVVYTATHVVFDEDEASHTSIRFFYDSDDSPEVIFHNVHAAVQDIEQDRCLLICVTCDADLGEKLYQMWKKFHDVWWKIDVKYKDNKDKDRVAIIVSHPHGCSKQVSIGQWKNKYWLSDDQYYKFTYTACTCPGSSGASVYCVGYRGLWWMYHLIHSGAFKSGLNVSGAADVF